MSSKQAKQARDAEENKARRVAARQERDSKRTSNASKPIATKQSAHTLPRSSLKKPSPPVATVPVNDVPFEREDRDGGLAIFLTVCSMALMALLIIAVLKAA